MAKLGIDLGTANSAAALFLEGSKVSDTNPFVIEPVEGTSDGAFITPSYIAFDNDGNVSVVGLSAKERYQRGGSQNVLRHLKRLIGRPYNDVIARAMRGERSFAELKDKLYDAGAGKVGLKVAGRKIPLEQAVSYLLEKIFADAQKVADKRGEPINGVTISLPAGFDDLQRGATLEAAKEAELETVDVIEEPTAAALARGLDGCTGNVMVIDIGAGTTDIVVGPMRRNRDGYPCLDHSARTCDDELGGIDMDYRIFDYLLKNETLEPRLGDIYTALSAAEKGKLMGAIENGKIMASLSGMGVIVAHLSVGTRSKSVNLPLPLDLLTQIVRPLLVGQRTGDMIKGLKPLLEKTLLKLASENTERLTKALGDKRHQAVTSYMDPELLRTAGFDPGAVKERVREVIQQIEHVVLVGGPCRMRSVHAILAELFAENDKVIEQLEKLEPANSFFMEAVARGATLGAGTSRPLVPYNISVFTWHKGLRAVVIPQGTPYTRGKELVKSQSLGLEEGQQTLHVLSEKECPRAHWPYREYPVSAPKTGSISVTLSWKEQGLDVNQAIIEGPEAGITSKVKFPMPNGTATLGQKVQVSFQAYLAKAKMLRAILPQIRKSVVEDVLKEIIEKNSPPGTPEFIKQSTINQFLSEHVDLSELDLQKCEALDDPEKISQPTEEDLERVLSEGYFAARDDLAVKRWGIPKKAVEVLQWAFMNTAKITPENVMSVGEAVLAKGEGKLEPGNLYVRQLKEQMMRMREDPKDRGVGAETVMKIYALAMEMHDNRNPPLIDDRSYEAARYISLLYMRC